MAGDADAQLSLDVLVDVSEAELGARTGRPALTPTRSDHAIRVPTRMEAASVIAPAVDRQKALGAFYTPLAMAEKMVAWAVREPSDTALDPSFGGLVFLEAAHARLLELGLDPAAAGAQLYGCDLDEDAHAPAAARAELHVREGALLLRDFFAAVPGKDVPLVAAVVGNPPYVRYQLHNAAGAGGRRIAEAAGLNLTRLASSWAPFLLHSADCVAPGGRLALVLPAELMHAQYAGDVMSWVQRRFARTALVVFEQRVFPGALEEVVLLFAEGRGEGQSDSVGLLACDSLADLDLDMLQARLSNPPARSPRRGKLLAQLLHSDARDLYDGLADDARVSSLGAIASVDIGAVTGANDFFLLREGQEPGLAPELLRPAVSKAVHISGARFTSSDFDRLRGQQTRCLLFVTDKGTPDALLDTAQAHLSRGEADGIPERYKCRVRTPWHAVPLPKHGVPDLFLTYCAAEFPRISANEAGALHTNTLHGVTLREGTGVDAAALAFAFYSSLTLLSAELVGRSYGGGVLKLEPTEAEALLIPSVLPFGPADLSRMDGLVRARKLEEILDLVDALVLVDGLGLTWQEVFTLRAGGERLRSRRRARNKPPR